MEPTQSRTARPIPKGKPRGGEVPALETQRVLFDRAYEHLSHALTLEQEGKVEEAFSLYDSGVDALRKGTSLAFTAAEWIDAEELHKTMTHRLACFAPHLEELRGRLTVASGSRSDVGARNETSVKGSAAAPPWWSRLSKSLGFGGGGGGGGGSVPQGVHGRPQPTAHPSPKRKAIPSAKPPPTKPHPPASNPNPSTCTPSYTPQVATPSPGDPKSALKGVEPTMQKIILNELIDNSPSVGWDDIVGLDNAKQTLKEMIILPSARPDIFTDLRAPPRGILLFGPPGNGKTMLAKAVASGANARFFSISSSSLIDKFLGQSERLVRALFAVAAYLAPSVIFIDEVDSLLSERSSNEHDATRRVKTEFLVQFDGVSSGAQGHVVVMGATNRPQELDEAARRRFTKRVYITLPEQCARRAMIQKLLKKEHVSLSEKELTNLIAATERFSGADMRDLVREAAFEPIRELGDRVWTIPKDDVRPITYRDFQRALHRVHPSVSYEGLRSFEEFNRLYGTFSGC